MRSTWGGGGGASWMGSGFYGIPVVRALVIAAVVTFLAYFFVGQAGGPVAPWLAFSTEGGLGWLRAWTWLTYPFVEVSPLSLLLQGYWLWVVGGMLERSWGWRRFLPFFFALTAISCIVFVPAFYLLGRPVTLWGLMLVNSGLTVTWAALDPELELNFYGVLPVKLKALALVDVLLVYFGFGLNHSDPVLALFTLAAPAAGWLYIRKLPAWTAGSPFGAARRPSRGPNFREPLLREEPPRREQAGRRNPLRKRQEQEEIARLRKLLGDDDDGDRPLRH